MPQYSPSLSMLLLITTVPMLVTVAATSAGRPSFYDGHIDAYDHCNQNPDSYIGHVHEYCIKKDFHVQELKETTDNGPVNALIRTSGLSFEVEPCHRAMAGRDLNGQFDHYRFTLRHDDSAGQNVKNSVERDYAFPYFAQLNDGAHYDNVHDVSRFLDRGKNYLLIVRAYISVNGKLRLHERRDFHIQILRSEYHDEFNGNLVTWA